MQSKKKYTHIFFDLDNTLWDFNQNSFYAMRTTFDKFATKVQNIEFGQFFEIYSKHNHALWTEYGNKNIGKKELIRKRFQNTFDELKIDSIDAEQMNSFYLKEMPKQKILNDGALDILHYLRNKRYQLFIITNGFKEVQNKKLENSGLKSFFQKVFISEDIKTPKPGVGIFEYAIKSANAKKAGSLMIGDNWEGDILGAVGFGIDSVYFTTEKGKLEKQKNIGMKTKNSIYIIDHLIHLRDIL